MWSTITPLICFEIVEWHPNDRVMHLFGHDQPIPRDAVKLKDSHNLELRGKQDHDWREQHKKWITIWNHRSQNILQGPPNYSPLASEEYLNWYRQSTLSLWLSPAPCLQGPRERGLPLRRQHWNLSPEMQWHYARMEQLYGQVPQPPPKWSNIMARGLSHPLSSIMARCHSHPSSSIMARCHRHGECPFP